MKLKRSLFLWTFILLALAVLAGCTPALVESPPLNTPVTVVTATATAEPTDTPAPPTATLEPSKTFPPPTRTPTATATDMPASDPVEDPPPVNGEPVIVTNDFTNVRRGPGLAYEVSHVLSPNTTAPVQGRNAAGDWWAVPGPGDGPGPLGWVSGAVVLAQGNLSSVPVLPAPPLEADLPVVGNGGLPPGGDTCVVAHPGPGDTGPTYLRQGPGNSFDAIAILGLNRWAAIMEAQSGWYRIQDDSGAGGWVHESTVSFAGRCSGPGSGPDLPVVEDPGSPPSNACVALRPGQFPPPGIHLGPGRQFALIARLGNWAEVLKTEAGWRQILLGPGDVGWVSDEDVDLIGPCATPQPAPQRIQFAPGETSATLEGMLEPPQRDDYLFRAFAGQQVTIEIVSESNRAGFAVSGTSDGQPYKRLEDEQRIWSAELPQTQDYLLAVAAPVDAPPTGYRVFVTIEPLGG